MSIYYCGSSVYEHKLMINDLVKELREWMPLKEAGDQRLYTGLTAPPEASVFHSET